LHFQNEHNSYEVPRDAGLGGRTAIRNEGGSR